MSQVVLAWVKVAPSGAVAVACPVVGPHAWALVSIGTGMEGVVTMSSLEGGLSNPSALTATTCTKRWGGPKCSIPGLNLHQLALPVAEDAHSTAQLSSAQRTAFQCTLA